MNPIAPHWLPGRIVDGQRTPAQPCPDLLTAEEAVRYLRLDEDDVADPHRSLAYYREKGLLSGRRIGKSIKYLRAELNKFIEQEGRIA